MAYLHRKEIDERELDTVLAEDFIFEGELLFTKPLMIKGPFRGDIQAKGDLYIDQNAHIEARIEAKLINVRGHVIGNLIATERIELIAGSRVDGDLTAPEVLMEAGALFNGICTMTAVSKGVNS